MNIFVSAYQKSFSFISLKSKLYFLSDFIQIHSFFLANLLQLPYFDMLLHLKETE